MPISSFFGLQTSLRGLLAQQRAIDVTGHNIANASTPGYSRQEAVMAAAPALPIHAGAIQTGTGAHIGAGVDVQAYRRIRDNFLDIQYRTQSTRLGQQATTAQTLDRAELALAEPGDNGIATGLSRFWNAWADLANAPEDRGTRQALIEQAQALGDTFASVDAQFAVVGRQAAEEYASLTATGGEIDGIAKEIAALNGTIVRFVSAGDIPNDLLDRRDALLDKLAGFGQTSSTTLPDGSIEVAFGDAAGPLVTGTTVAWPQTLTAPGGRLGALKEVSEPGGTIATYRSALSAVARQLADTVNAVHGAPGFFSYTPGSEASTLTVDVTAADVRTSSTPAPGGNDVALAITALRGGPADAAYRALVAQVGTDVREAHREEAVAKVLASSVDDRRQSVAGVALDEEMTNLVRFQRAYQASARAMSSMDEMLDILINRTGRVGL